MKEGEDKLTYLYVEAAIPILFRHENSTQRNQNTPEKLNLLT